MSCTNSVYEFTYTYGARWYDATGRLGFTTMDPLCEEDYSVSPYVYCRDNPINAVDPDGKRPKVIERWSSSKYYIGNLYEKEVCDGEVIERNFIYANNQVVAIYEMSGSNSDQFFYMHHDHIGSIIGASDSNGHLVDNFSYDAWGNRRNPDNYSDTNVSPEDIVSTDHGFTGHEHIDLLGLINMNGRIYDPILGRFLSPDPLVQAPDMTQSLNRYAYCLNNPLTLTDPSGYSWVGTTFAAITGIAVALETGGLAAGLEGAVISGALGGASAAMMSSVINGANFRQTAKNTYTGAFWGAFSSCVSYEIGDISNVYARIAAHTAAEGAMEGIRGGHIEHGMLVGFTSSVGGYYINRYGSQLGTVGKVAANAALSGVVAEIGGGKFASGAMTGAFIMMYNELQHDVHTYYNREFERRQKLRATILSDGILELRETIQWWQEGDGESLTVDANKLNLDFLDTQKILHKNIGEEFTIYTFDGNFKQAVVYGKLTGIYEGNGYISIKNDVYDFNIETWKKDNFWRNVGTIYSKWIHGPGQSFTIYFQGKYKLK